MLKQTCATICVLAAMAILSPLQAQPPDAASNAVVHGHVRDSSGRPMANAAVFLQPAAGKGTTTAPPLLTHTDSAGAYRFASLPAGAYTLRAEMNGYAETTAGPVTLARKETREIDLTLVTAKAQAPEFFDEPRFTVAGVTQSTNSGGHGSDTALRTTEALARATVSLSKEPLSKESTGATSPPAPAAAENSLREALARNPNNAALHHQLGDVEEKLGNPLEAVREYQRAAELDPSEPDIFDWGAELLAHSALEPATEVFAKGNRLFPKSVRMLVALGVAWYARGSYGQAVQCLVNASDLDPGNPTPYLFLGRMQSVETIPSAQSAERLARFAQLQPKNALANYDYAVALWKQSANAAEDNGRFAHVEALLLKAVHLDPKFAAAYLQLGILYSQRADFSQAISAYQKAIEVSPETSLESTSLGNDETLAEAHYRLAQAYQRTGNQAGAKEQLQLHAQLTKKIKDNTERQQREVQRFVMALRNKDSASQ
jgi:tetratricopeptide (TPR) repeat protein